VLDSVVEWGLAYFAGLNMERLRVLIEGYFVGWVVWYFEVLSVACY